MAEDKKSELIGTRVTPALKRAAERAAKEDSRSLSSMVEKLIADHCRKVGTLKGKRLA